MSAANSGSWSPQVAYMRLVAVILLITVHSLAVYTGAWESPFDSRPIDIYWWIGEAAYSFMLETFVFLSGYLFALSARKKGRIISGGKLARSKFHRLLLPCWVFGVLYYFMFVQNGAFGLGGFLYGVINGEGHLWFLVMLFWCFLGGWALMRIRTNDLWILAFLAVLSVCAVVPLPLRLDRACYYLVYFWLGVCLFNDRNHLVDRLSRPKWMVRLWMAWLVFFVALTPVIESIHNVKMGGPVEKALLYASINGLRMVVSVAGVVALYATVNYFVKIKPANSPPRYAGISIMDRLSFGVYIYQQFILLLLYYKTSLPALVGPYWLPVVGFTVTFGLSYALAWLTVHTKPGKYLIG